MPAILACCVICLGVLLSLLSLCLGIAEIVMGAKHLRDCPVQDKIPIYLVVAGCTGLLLSMTNAGKLRKARQSRERGGEAEAKGRAGRIISSLISLISLFAFIWFVCGMVWIFGAAPTFETASATGNSTVVKAATASANSTVIEVDGTAVISTYCFKPLFVFAKVAVLIRLILVLLSFVLALCACCACCGTAMAVA